MKKILFYSLLLAFSLTSCTDYLDKTADSTVDEETAFINFKNFQGFIEEIYNCIPNKESCNWCTNWNWGEDEIFNTIEGDAHFTHHVDIGDYKYWYTTNQQNFLWPNAAGGGGTVNPASNDKFQHALWPHAWYCIRKAHLGLANLDKLTVATTEEKNLIAGQLYFFRAWWYEELMQFFGGFPYIDRPLEATEEMKFPRLSFQECADRCAEDFEKAATLLPEDWDETVVGKTTLNKNNRRITKAVALAYAGKVLLWAASPLMEHGAEMDGADTYNYNKTYAQKAMDKLGQCLALIETGKTPYKLADFKYEDIYEHKKDAEANTCFTDIFYTTGQNWKTPGTCEAMMCGPVSAADVNGTNWNMAKTWGTKIDGLVEHDKIIHQPTANYVNYAYGMADGTPAYIVKDGQLVPNTAAEGGSFDPTHPFKDRDPRFYHDIIFDGFRYVTTDIPSSDVCYIQQYCGLYTGGYTRDDNMGSRTGYYTQKLVPHTCNKFDKAYEWAGSLTAYLPYMRLADVYLMYAEACAAVGGATTKASNYSKTAEDAINVLRDRVGAGHVAAAVTGNNQKFMDEVRRERACELAFEGFRWQDLQRWLLLTVAPYTQKTSQEFYRVKDASWYQNNDPRDAEVTGWSEKNILTRDFRAKHYWLPLPEKEVYLYAEFEQNPGW
ncbi:MAG: RagB/SusD family nutrient uptake outer membrane protein [Prevotellaceae bacterium]|nr:RagB/SusD family nutrient uptake outer membrane protein [Prevotellaceae bacterium]